MAALSEKEIKALLPLCILGKAYAQQSLYEAFLPYIYTICKRYFIPEHFLKDMVQEIFSSMFLSLEKYQESAGSFKPWLRSIAVYKIIDHKRKKKPQSLELLDYTEQVSTDNNALSELYLQNLLNLISTMPDGYRIVFNMFLIEGFSHKEIAVHLKITEKTSRSQLSRAKGWLRNKINEQLEESKELKVLINSI